MVIKFDINKDSKGQGVLFSRNRSNQDPENGWGEKKEHFSQNLTYCPVFSLSSGAYVGTLGVLVMLLHIRVHPL